MTTVTILLCPHGIPKEVSDTCPWCVADKSKAAPMSSDLVTRLRHWSREDDLDIGVEAADEIERLRSENTSMRNALTEIGRFREKFGAKWIPSEEAEIAHKALGKTP